MRSERRGADLDLPGSEKPVRRGLRFGAAIRVSVSRAEGLEAVAAIQAVSPVEAMAAIQAMSAAEAVSPVQAMSASRLHERFPS